MRPRKFPFTGIVPFAKLCTTDRFCFNVLVSFSKLAIFVSFDVILNEAVLLVLVSSEKYYIKIYNKNIYYNLKKHTPVVTLNGIKVTSYMWMVYESLARFISKQFMFKNPTSIAQINK